jgi:hypothetical protein
LLAASSSMFPVIGHWNSATAQRTLLERPTNSCCAFRLVISPHDFVTRERRRAHNVELEHRSHTAPQLLTAHPAQHDLLQWCHVEAEHLHQEVRAPAMRSILQPWHTGTCCSGSVQNPPRAAMERHARWWSVDSISCQRHCTPAQHRPVRTAPAYAARAPHTHTQHGTAQHSAAKGSTAVGRGISQPCSTAAHAAASACRTTPGQREIICLFVCLCGFARFGFAATKPRAACGKLGKSIVRRERECARC